MERLKEILSKINPRGILYALCLLYVVAWILNGLKGLKFDLPEMRSTIATIGTYIGVVHGTNSLLNTPKGEGPLGGPKI